MLENFIRSMRFGVVIASYSYRLGFVTNLNEKLIGSTHPI